MKIYAVLGNSHPRCWRVEDDKGNWLGDVLRTPSYGVHVFRIDPPLRARLRSHCRTCRRPPRPKVIGHWIGGRFTTVWAATSALLRLE